MRDAVESLRLGVGFSNGIEMRHGAFPMDLGNREPQGSKGTDLKGVLSEDVLSEALRKAEETSRIFGRDLKFLYRKEADIYQVEVIDRGEDKVIRKIPPDEVVKLIENINKLLGMLFDDKF
ncbi:flagellar protein FlaG [Thermanaerovibrio velox DSM 12556]|uniref:Flagellar protein FlaG n=1 Tax=Thermanaerovibrio velox DSM 12556 TaxID=926567 RepID=H0USG1_9BACT|nr:flagellar protein FlaG [Thermanaerovibrio velox]EHM10250.1 flagellar protein FlaG [Thermanaerovibrio velox DSM 12556]